MTCHLKRILWDTGTTPTGYDEQCAGFVFVTHDHKCGRRVNWRLLCEPQRLSVFLCCALQWAGRKLLAPKAAVSSGQSIKKSDYNIDEWMDVYCTFSSLATLWFWGNYQNAHGFELFINQLICNRVSILQVISLGLLKTYLSLNVIHFVHLSFSFFGGGFKKLKCI